MAMKNRTLGLVNNFVDSANMMALCGQQFYDPARLTGKPRVSGCGFVLIKDCLEVYPADRIRAHSVA